MVLWELTLATAYWLGLRKTYRLALRLQRRLIGHRHPRLRDFLKRRTRNVFDVALTVHKEIQTRDLSAGRSLGNFILRFLDRMRPSAHIRGSSELQLNAQQKKLLSDHHGNGSAMKHASGTTTPAGEKSEAGSGSVHDKFSVSQRVLDIHAGQAVRKGINVDLGMMRQGIAGPKPGPGVRTLLSAASSLWGQAAKENLETSIRMSKPAVPVFPKKGIFREDIAEWLVQTSQDKPQPQRM